jgi:predicted ATPase
MTALSRFQASVIALFDYRMDRWALMSPRVRRLRPDLLPKLARLVISYPEAPL